MKTAVPDARLAWRRWWTFVVVLCLAQLAVVMWLAEPGPRPVVATPREPRVLLAAEGDDQVLALLNPTLFAWGGADAFAGEALTGANPPARRPPRYTEPLRWMALAPDDLTGIATVLAIPTEAPSQLAQRGLPAPTTVPDVLGTTTLRRESICVLADELAQRRMPDPLTLPAIPHADVLGETVVQLTLDAAGELRSVVLLESSGLAAADVLALETARRMRFAPLPGTPRLPLTPVPPLITGEAVFRWHTVPPPAE